MDADAARRAQDLIIHPLINYCAMEYKKGKRAEEQHLQLPPTPSVGMTNSYEHTVKGHSVQNTMTEEQEQ